MGLYDVTGFQVLKKCLKIAKIHYFWSLKYTKLVNHYKKYVIVGDPIPRDYFVLIKLIFMECLIIVSVELLLLKYIFRILAFADLVCK